MAQFIDCNDPGIVYSVSQNLLADSMEGLRLRGGQPSEIDSPTLCDGEGEWPVVEVGTHLAEEARTTRHLQSIMGADRWEEGTTSQQDALIESCRGLLGAFETLPPSLSFPNVDWLD